MGNNIITETLFSEIKKLSGEAVASYHTKKNAKPYVEQLLFLRANLPDNPSVRDLFDKLVNHVDAATGHGRDKQHWLFFVSRDLVLLELEFNRLNHASDTEIR